MRSTQISNAPYGTTFFGFYHDLDKVRDDFSAISKSAFDWFFYFSFNSPFECPRPVEDERKSKTRHLPRTPIFWFVEKP